VYTVLFQTAKQTGQLPETLAAQWLTAVTKHLTDDPVEQFIGTFKSPVADWADNHDTYLGNAVMETMKTPDYPGGAHE
jgi:hypothetical protein